MYCSDRYADVVLFHWDVGDAAPAIAFTFEREPRGAVVGQAVQDLHALLATVTQAAIDAWDLGVLCPPF